MWIGNAKVRAGGTAFSEDIYAIRMALKASYNHFFAYFSHFPIFPAPQNLHIPFFITTFAPGRDGEAHAPAALMTANGLQFTVTGLDSNTQYGYSVTAKDANDQTVATYSGEFTTTSEGIATGIEETSSSLQGGDRGRLILHNGQISILCGDKTYTLQGKEVR